MFQLLCFFALTVLTGCSLLGLGGKSEADEAQKTAVPAKAVRKDLSAALSKFAKKPEVIARLKTLENRISSKKELEQYSKALPYMKSADERIEFLQLEGFEERQEWLRTENFPSRPNVAEDDMKEMVTAQDISLGMPSNLVKRSWGDPDSVEVSGNPQFKNERWRYDTYVSTPDGYRMEKKFVYFEGGKVVGWEVD